MNCKLKVVIASSNFAAYHLYELSPAFFTREYFTLPPQLTTGEAVYGRVAKVVLLLQEVSRKECIDGLEVGMTIGVQ